MTRSAEDLRAMLDALDAAKEPTSKTLVLDLSGTDADHTMVERKDGTVRCRRCGAGYFKDRPPLLPKACRASAYMRQKLYGE